MKHSVVITFVTLLYTFVQVSFGNYTLETDYSGNSFFDKFDFYSGPDPIHGFVQYQNKTSAQSMGLAYVDTDGHFIMRADNTSVTPNGRPSIRIESKELYNSSRLFIFDLNHMPTGCGTWAAYWFRGEYLPKDGEFDILEGTNKQTKNDINVHTGQNCFMNSTQQIMTGEAALQHANCNVNSTGCNVHSKRTDSYGAGLNKNQGGIYAMRWNDETGVQVWFFPRHQYIPSNIYSSSPQPETWGTPVADYPFGSTCSPSNFKNMRIIINLTFCGRWAGSKSTFGGAYHCPGNCTTFVENNPHAFSEAYWNINSLKVYKKKVTK